MAGDDLFIGNDGEYVLRDDGSFETTATVASAVRHQLLDRINEWVGDPEAGREIKGINGRNNTEEEADRDRDNILRALQAMEDEGLITDIEIEVDRDPQGRIGFNIRTRDTQTGSSITVETLTLFGV